MNFIDKWKKALQNVLFRNYLIIIIVIAASLLLLLPTYFNYIEKRNGIVLNDPILDWLPAINVSTPAFIILWGMVLLLIFKSLHNPELFLRFAWCLILLHISRVVSIGITPLNAPRNLIILKDPLSSHFYDVPFITKDLFYSGHTATLFLMFLCFQNKLEKGIALIASSTMGILVLIQHIHYTIDVVTAPFFAWLIYLLVQRILKKVLAQSNINNP